MAQYALPTSDDANVGPWVQGAGDGDGSFFDELDEGFGAGRGSGAGPDDATTYWTSPTSPSNDLITTNLSAVTDPAVSTGHVFRSRNRKSASAGKQIDALVVLFYSGGAASLSASNINEVWTTRSATLSTAEADAITNYASFQMKTEMTSVGGGAGRAGWESAHEFECPDAPVVTLVPEMYGGMPTIPPCVMIPY